MLTPGQAHDVQGFGPLFRMIADRVHALLADRGYDADAIRAEIAIAGTQAVIPAKKGRRSPALHDRQKYRLRNQIERLFNVGPSELVRAAFEKPRSQRLARSWPMR